MKKEEITLQQEDNSTDGTSQERYADELVGPDDYWLTILLAYNLRRHCCKPAVVLDDQAGEFS